MEVELSHYRAVKISEAQLALETGGEYVLKPVSGAGTGTPREPEMESLAEVVARMNDLFAGDLSDADLVAYAQHITGKLLEDDGLAEQAAQNPIEQFALGDFSGAMIKAVVGGLGNYQAMAAQVLENDETRDGFAKLIIRLVYEGFAKQRDAAAS